MRRNLLVIVLGISFLILMTWIGTIITSIIPHRVTASTQTAQAGPYLVTLQVHPNPPLITQPATLTVQLVNNASHEPVTNAQVTLESDMESMDMGTNQADASLQGNSIYVARVQFSMSGLWQIRVDIAIPGSKTVSAVFEVTAQ